MSSPRRAALLPVLFLFSVHVALGQDNWEQGAEQPGALANRAPAQPRNIALRPPWELTPQEQADLDALLVDWENSSSKIKTFKCAFTRYEYDPTFVNNDPNQPKTTSVGELKYAAPDKGLFRVLQVIDHVPDAQPGKVKDVPGGPGEYWTSDGKSIFEVNHRTKKIIERPIPPQLQGHSITEGPLPFVFGAKAKTLKARYHMRIITPPEVQDDVWLEARPKFQKDAANYSRVELILTRSDLLPKALQIYDPGAAAQNQSRTVIILKDPSVNSPWAQFQQLLKDFAQPTMLGYKHEVEQPELAPAAPQQAAEHGDVRQRAR